MPRTTSITLGEHQQKFVECLSIIDTMMFNSPEKIIEMLEAYTLK